MARVNTKFSCHTADIFAFVLFFISGLAVSRLLYEAAFPHLLDLARPIPTLLLATLTGVIGWLCWRWINRKLEASKENGNRGSLSIWAFTPLLINLVYIVDPATDLLRSQLFFAISIWLTALFIAQALVDDRRWSWLGLLFIVAALLPIYLFTMPDTVGSADTFEFQVVIPQLGIAHPTGYPLYLLLGRLFAFIPAGSVAWRVNLASVTFAILAMIMLYATVRHLIRRPIPSVLTVVVLGVTPVYWSQAVEAEVYALHALFVAAVLWLMTVILGPNESEANCSGDIIHWPVHIDWQRAVIILVFLIGLGLANHLTTLFLLPPALLVIFLAYRFCIHRQSAKANGLLLLKMIVAFLLPLLLYAYLPLRWFSLHGEAMGLGRFTQWVIGGRFQGALQLAAWLTDMTRYQVVGRLMLQNWGWVNLILIFVGLLYLIFLNWRVALVLFVTWLGFAFYALNYYVPDLAVFIIPAHVVMAIYWGVGLAALLAASEWLIQQMNRPSWRAPAAYILILFLLLPSLYRLSDSWLEITGDDNSKLQTWGEGVLAMPLENGAAILADSEKIAPLYYLQQAEGIRPDLDIMVLPDEAAYRAELDKRIAVGQTVYLARFLPALAGVYHLRSVGPLIEVSQEPLLALPDEVEQTNLSIGPLQLLGVELQTESLIDPDAAAVTLYWQTEEPLSEPHYTYLRWKGEDIVTEPIVRSGQQPAGNSYPTGAWQVAEIVPDFHLLPRPVSDKEQTLELQVAVGPSFQSPEALAWQRVAAIDSPPMLEYETRNPLRAQNGRVLLSGVQIPSEVRPQTPLDVVLTGYGKHVRELELALQPIGDELVTAAAVDIPDYTEAAKVPFVYTAQVDTDLPNGRYYLMSRDPQAGTVCGWLDRKTNECILGEVNISGVPLPVGATNFEDKITLLDVDLAQSELRPGGQLPVNLRWQSLSSMDEDYTVFIQVLDAQDRIVGQVDAWPLQGTYPTSQWEPGEIVEDPYLVQLANDMPPGQYKLQIGWYLLSTLQRLAVLNEDGLAVDDKRTITDLVVPH